MDVDPQKPLFLFFSFIVITNLILGCIGHFFFKIFLVSVIISFVGATIFQLTAYMYFGYVDPFFLVAFFVQIYLGSVLGIFISGVVLFLKNYFLFQVKRTKDK